MTHFRLIVGWVAVCFVILTTSMALSGSATLTVKDGNGIFQNMGVTTDGSGNLYSNQVIVDGTAAGNKAAVTSGNALKVDGSAVTQPVSISTAVTTSPPANASTNVSQVGGSTVSLGQTTMTGSIPVVLPSNQSTINVNCSSGCPGSGPADESTFTQGTTSFSPIGGFFNNSVTNLTSGQGGVVQLTNDRMMFTNLGKVGGTAVSLGQKTMSSSLPVAIASDQGTLTTNVAQINGTAPTVKASGTNAATTDTALVVASSPNPSTVCTSVKAVNQTASTDLVTSVNKLHICSIVLVSATAQNISLVEGTGSTCATGIAALIGGTTASMAVAANGGFSTATSRPWLVTQTVADHLCLLQSGAGNVSGIITYQDHS